MSMAGLDEDEDMFAGVLTSARRRAVWLSVNLATAFLAANVVGLFEANDRESRRARRTHADRREHGRHRRAARRSC